MTTTPVPGQRIHDTFSAARAAGRKLLVGFLTAGDPDRATSLADMRDALDNGVDLLEVGVPFSDPTADGPTIQAAGRRALDAGMTLSDVLTMVRELRHDYDAPIILMGYANPFLQYGYARLCADAVAAGVDGFLAVDMPHEEINELRAHANPLGLATVPLIAPTTPPERAAEIISQASGFTYYVSVKGVTGARTALPEDLHEHLDTLRACSTLPIAVGFGVGSGRMAHDISRYADAVVVGSALVTAARERRLPAFVRELRDGLDGDQ